MVTTRNLAIAAVLAAAALIAAAALVSENSGGGESMAGRPSVNPTVTSIPPATGGWPTPPSGATLPSNSAIQYVPHSAEADSFALVVKTRKGDLPANVGPISVASAEPVDPPHSTAEEWNTAVWVRQSTYPSAPSEGTAYVYGHACHYHVCPFTNLKDAAVGDQVVVTTPWGVLTYRIGQIGLSPKATSSLPSWASDSTVANRIVLVTCQFEDGDTSVNNIVVSANLIAATSRQSG